MSPILNFSFANWQKLVFLAVRINRFRITRLLSVEIELSDWKLHHENNVCFDYFCCEQFFSR